MHDFLDSTTILPSGFSGWVPISGGYPLVISSSLLFSAHSVRWFTYGIWRKYRKNHSNYRGFMGNPWWYSHNFGVKLMNMPIIVIVFILSYWEYDGKYSWNMIWLYIPCYIHSHNHHYLLVNCPITVERSTIFHGKTHELNGGYFHSYVTNYQRVSLIDLIGASYQPQHCPL